MKLKGVWTFCLLASLLWACAGASHPSRGPLSHAMEKASDGHGGERESAAPDTPPPFQQSADDKPAESLSAPQEANNPMVPASTTPLVSAPAGEEDPKSLVVVLSGGPGLIQADELEAMGGFDIAFGGYFSERQRIELYSGLGWADIEETSTLDQAIKGNVTMASLGLRYKLFTTPRHTFLGHYFVAGLNYTWMFWSYKNRVQTDGETIGSDYIGGWEVSAGMGLHLVQTRHFQIGIEVLPSVILWESTTHEGFDNDVFDNPLMLKLRGTVTWVK